VEDQARLDVTRAASEARQARSQRDEALNALRAVEMEQSNHTQQLQGWKTAVRILPTPICIGCSLDHRSRKQI
jgi:outer membrane PBP1 activator LpoA protein